MISVQYFFLFNRAKQTFSSVVYAILQCKKTDILEPNRTPLIVEPQHNQTRTIRVLSSDNYGLHIILEVPDDNCAL